MRPNALTDVWSKVDRSGGPDACWPWTGALSHGYGLWTYAGRSIRAHRAAWRAEHGDIPDDLKVLHRCDNPPCCNPSHLFLGTYRDNNEDMWAKGRGKADTHAAQHGTYAGYLRHVRQRSGEWGMPACQPCRDANAAYRRSRAASTKADAAPPNRTVRRQVGPSACALSRPDAMEVDLSGGRP